MYGPAVGLADKLNLRRRTYFPEIFRFTVDLQPAVNPNISQFPERDISPFGIQKITATTSSGGRAIRVNSPWGASSFGWPKGVKPVAFEIVTGKTGTDATISAPGFNEANRADYRAAIDAVVPVAIARTADAKAAKDHTRR